MRKILESMVFETILTSLLATIYSVAFLSKAAAGREFISDLGSYGLHGIAAQLVFLVVLGLELATVFLLLSKQYRKWGAVMVIATQLLFMTATGLALITGMTPECSCFGSMFKRSVNMFFFLEDSIIALCGALLYIRSRSGNFVRTNALAIAISTSMLVGAVFLISTGVREYQSKQASAKWSNRSMSDLQVTLAGQLINLPVVLQNREAFVMFFSPTCSHCHNVMKRIPEIEKGHKVHHIFIDVTGQSDQALSTVRSFELEGEVFSATTPGQYIKWVPQGVPVLFLVDGNANIKTSYTGDVPDDKLREVLGLNEKNGVN